MDYGVVMFPTEYAIAPDELARALEERGFESVWFPEHTHIPASRRTPWPGGRRDEGDGADEQCACCYRVAEQAGDGGGESRAAHVGDPSERRRRLRRRHLDEPALSPRR